VQQPQVASASGQGSESLSPIASAALPPADSHGLTTQAAAASVQPVSPAEAKALIATATHDHMIQTGFQQAPKTDPLMYAWVEALGNAIRKLFKVLGVLFEPLAPFVPYILWLLVFIAVVALASPVVRMFLSTRFERLFLRGNLNDDVRWRPTKEAVSALLEEIDALADKGQFDEAVHLLLIRSVADINAYRPDIVRIHYSARDIGSHPLMPDTARPAFAEIARWAELSYFAGQTVGKPGFDACRAAYMAFIHAEGIA
jgi:hypothetical protein